MPQRQETPSIPQPSSCPCSATAGHLLKVLMITGSAAPARMLESGCANKRQITIQQCSGSRSCIYLFRLAVGTSHSGKCQAMGSHIINLLLQVSGDRTEWGTFSAKPLRCTISSAKKHLIETTWYFSLHLCDNPQNWLHELQEVAPRERRASCSTSYPSTHHLLPTHTSFPLEKGAAQ